jgi:hypothetical protein
MAFVLQKEKPFRSIVLKIFTPPPHTPLLNKQQSLYFHIYPVMSVYPVKENVGVCIKIC